MKTSTLALRWRTRAGGGGRTERRYLDLVVDGTSLQDRLRVGDRVTCLGCWTAAAERGSIQQLLARAPAESPGGRVPLYVCAECGDLGCGAVTVRVERTAEGFVWRDFMFENDYDAGTSDLEPYREVGPFLFDEAEYARVLHERAPHVRP